MPTITEINNPKASYCKKWDMHCYCPKCKFYSECYYDYQDNCQDICIVADWERAEAIDGVLRCENRETYQELENNPCILKNIR